MDDLCQRQLSAIAQFSYAARLARRPVWLRGGWAVDFVLGRVSRPHRDVDWFALSEDADQLVGLLQQRGWTVAGSAPSDQQRDMVKDDLDFGIALIRLDEGQPIVAGGPFAGEPWPSTMIAESHRRRLHGVDTDVIGVAAQIEIKRMMPTWVPTLGRRQKDLDDIKLLEEALTR